MTYLETYWDPYPKIVKTTLLYKAFLQIILHRVPTSHQTNTTNMAIRGVNNRQTPICTCKTYYIFGIIHTKLSPFLYI